MSTSNGAFHAEETTSLHRQGGFPWMPVLAVAGVAAAAIFLLKKLQNDEHGDLTMAQALDQCSRAAHTLDDRMRTFAGDF